jgi:hypothetical protein
MKPLLLNRIAFCAQAVLMMFAISLTAVAAPADSNQASDGSQGFNHAHTGYQLSGAHAVAVCETCHTGGIFKGTPVECDGCHAIGRRVVATPKSTAHIVTTAACDTCHFNKVTFLGARFNHGMATPGGCISCHNDRQAEGKPASHSIGSMAIEPCDQCHKTSAFLPASWNHSGIVGGCDDAGCHVVGSNQYFKSITTHVTTGMSTLECTDCHNYFAWSPARYNHNTGALCSSCHGATSVFVQPENRKPTDSHFFTTECNTCHRTTMWEGASYHSGNVAGFCGTCHNDTNGIKGMKSDPNGIHIPLSAGGDPNCDLCHTSTETFSAHRMNHSGITTCNGCHASTSTYVVSIKKPIGNHQGSTVGQDCSACHTTTTTWAGALGAKPVKHIPYANPSEPCGSCHVNGATKRGSALHAYLTGISCHTCHGSNTIYDGQGQKIEPWPNYHERDENPTATDCSDSGCHRPRGPEGNLYLNWD